MSTHINKVAEVCHEANRAYCATIGDMSQPAWVDAPDWQRESAIKGVRFHNENPNASPSASHEEWAKLKWEDGWKYGPVKDAEKKTHPCLLPYGQLPVEQRQKDYLFRAIVHAFAECGGISLQ